MSKCACLDEKSMQVSGTEIWKTLLVEHHSILPVKSNDLFCAWKCAAVIQGCKTSKFLRCNPQMDWIAGRVWLNPLCNKLQLQWSCLGNSMSLVSSANKDHVVHCKISKDYIDVTLYFWGEDWSELWVKKELGEETNASLPTMEKLLDIHCQFMHSAVTDIWVSSLTSWLINLLWEFLVLQKTIYRATKSFLYVVSQYLSYVFKFMRSE